MTAAEDIQIAYLYLTGKFDRLLERFSDLTPEESLLGARLYEQFGIETATLQLWLNRSKITKGLVDFKFSVTDEFIASEGTVNEKVERLAKALNEMMEAPIVSDVELDE